MTPVDEYPRLSLAMCTHNAVPHIRQQLESIAAQTRLPDEAIICDDLSSDGTVTAIEGMIPDLPFPVRLLVNDVNLGVRKNFERAISLCSGDLVALSDQDDIWKPDKLMRSVTTLLRSPHAGYVFTDADVVDVNARPQGYRLWESVDFSQEDRNMVRAGRALDVLLAHNVVTGMTMVFRSSFRDLVLPIPADYPYWMHDGWIAAMISSIAEAAFIEEPLALYRQHTGHQIGAGPPGWFIPVSTSFARIEHLRTLYARLSVQGTKYEEAANRLLLMMQQLDLRRGSGSE